MLISVLGFALMNLTVKFLGRLPATELVLFRSLISIVLTVYFLKRRHIPLFGNQKKYLILRGIFGVIGLTLFFYTLQKLPLGSAITIQYLSPIFTAFFAIFILGEKMYKIQWLFFAVSFAGIAVIKGFDPNISLPLFLMGLGSAVFSGLAYNCVRKVKDTDHPLVVVFYFPLMAVPVMGIISLFNWVTPIGWEWGLLLLMGTLTQIAQVYMTKALQNAEVNEITGLKYLGVIFALGFDFLIFDVQYRPMALVGIAMVLSGVIINIIYKSQKRRKALSAQTNIS
ncbi:putative permease [Owenweeksia hongkongensis DSM 17368]|uniref:Putative permease n=2 Tax=Owenweeksia TaxID=267986 RepID=G8R8S2_OWEHD|nr:putative permease [Owenweeksia hongkongensis DSM 17368]